MTTSTLAETPVSSFDGAPITPDRWGRDHYSTLAYIGHVIHNPKQRGWVDKDKMRCKRSRRGMAGMTQALLMAATASEPDRYPTQLQGGAKLHDHDDYDCADDLIAAGLLVETGTGFNRAYDFTPRGAMIWSLIVRKYPTAGSMDEITWAQFASVPS